MADRAAGGWRCSGPPGSRIQQAPSVDCGAIRAGRVIALPPPAVRRRRDGDQPSRSQRLTPTLPAAISWRAAMCMYGQLARSFGMRSPSPRPSKIASAWASRRSGPSGSSFPRYLLGRPPGRPLPLPPALLPGGMARFRCSAMLRPMPPQALGRGHSLGSDRRPSHLRSGGFVSVTVAASGRCGDSIKCEVNKTLTCHLGKPEQRAAPR